MADRRNLKEGSVEGHLAQLGLPMVAGIVAVMSVSLADTYFLSRLGTVPLAAVGFAFPVTLAIMSFGIGLGAGTASVVSRTLGGGNRDDARRLATDALLLALTLAAVFVAVGLLLVRPLFALLGAEGAVLDQVVAYMRIWIFGLPFLVVPMAANQVIRANGDARIPGATMIIAALINFALDPALIFGWWIFPRLEIEGAAWATVAARMATFCIALSVVAFKEKMLSFARPAAAELARSWRRVAAIALPAAAGNMVNPLGITVVTGILAVYGAETVAAFGVGAKVMHFVNIPMLALSAAIGPLAGQNWGAAKRKRVQRALRSAFVFCLGWASFAAAVFWLWGDAVAGWFASERSVAAIVQDYFAIVPLTTAGYGVTIIAAAAFNALGMPLKGLAAYLMRVALLYVPFTWAASLVVERLGAFYAIGAANAISGVAIAGAVFWWFARRGESGAAPRPDRYDEEAMGAQI